MYRLVMEVLFSAWKGVPSCVPFGKPYATQRAAYCALVGATKGYAKDEEWQEVERRPGFRRFRDLTRPGHEHAYRVVQEG